MRVLVTGATSGLGYNATQWLIEQGYDVLATGRNEIAGAALSQQGATFVMMDLTQSTPRQLANLMKGVDWVWHCAALSSPWGKWCDFYSCNTQVTRNLAAAAGEAKVTRFVHISTPSIYFDFEHRKNIPETFRAKFFANSYALSKAKAEDEIRSAQQSFLQTKYIILRPRGIFGPHDRVILPRVIHQVQLSKGVLKLPRGGGALLDLTFVGNVVHAMFLASTKASLPLATAYNITNHQPITLVNVLTQLLVDEVGMNFSIKSLPYPLLHSMACIMEVIAKINGKEPLFTRYSIGTLNFDMTLSQDKAQTELGYEPPYTLDEGIKQTAAWLKLKTGSYG